MSFSPLLDVHITAGTLGMLSGFVAVFLHKGSRRHGIAGNVFVISMLTLAVSGTFLAIMKSQVTNILGGVLTFYLVATGWATGRRKDGKTGIFDWVALLFALTVGGSQMIFGLQAALSQSGLKYGYPAGMYFFMGGVVLLAAAGDVRMLVRGGISGSQRIARHLWRMCFGLFIAAASIFLARPQFFPALMRKTGALTFLSYLPLALMIFWLVRVRFAKAYQHIAIRPRARLMQPISREKEYEPSLS
jgi:hypothetical protein